MSSEETNDGPALLKIGDFAELAGTNLRTLRYYEELGLMQPAERSTGGFRYYRATDVNRLRMIQVLQELGLPLERIREIMVTRDSSVDSTVLVARVRDALEEQRRLLDERMQSLSQQRDQVAEALAKLHDCNTCEHRPLASNNFCEPCALDGKPLPRDLSALF